MSVEITTAGAFCRLWKNSCLHLSSSIVFTAIRIPLALALIQNISGAEWYLVEHYDFQHPERYDSVYAGFCSFCTERNRQRFQICHEKILRKQLSAVILILLQMSIQQFSSPSFVCSRGSSRCTLSPETGSSPCINDCLQCLFICHRNDDQSQRVSVSVLLPGIYSAHSQYPHMQPLHLR